MHIWAHIPRRSQSMTLWSRFSSAHECLLGTELRSPSLLTCDLYLPSSQPFYNLYTCVSQSGPQNKCMGWKSALYSAPYSSVGHCPNQTPRRQQEVSSDTQSCPHPGHALPPLPVPVWEVQGLDLCQGNSVLRSKLRRSRSCGMAPGRCEWRDRMGEMGGGGET